MVTGSPLATVGEAKTAGRVSRAQAGATALASLFSAQLGPGGEGNDRAPLNQTKPEFRPRLCPTLVEGSEGHGTQEAPRTWSFG